MAFTLVTVTADYDRPDGGDPVGKVTFTPTVPMLNDQTVVAAPVSRALNIDGKLVIPVFANTDPGTTPTTARYLVEETIDGVYRSYYVQVPHNAGAFIDLTALAPVAVFPAPTPVVPSPPTTAIYSVPGPQGPAGPAGGLASAPTGNTVTDTVTVNTAKSTGLTLGVGTYVVNPLTIATGDVIAGCGPDQTVIKLANNANNSLIKSTDFATLTGVDTTTGTPHNFEVRDVTLDGNRANQSGTSHGLALFAYGYRLRNIVIRQCLSYGLWTEWGSAGPFLLPDGMEALISDFKIHDCEIGAIRHKGPHDSQFVNGIICKNVGTAASHYAVEFPTDGFSNGSTMTSVHVYGGLYEYGVRTLCSGLGLIGCQFEGGTVGQIYLGASTGLIESCKLFSGNIATATVKGIVCANSVNSWRIRAKVENCCGGLIDLGSGGGTHDIDLYATFYPDAFGTPTPPNPAVIGSLDPNTSYKVLVADPATGNLTAASLVRTGGSRLIGGPTPGLTEYGQGASGSITGQDGAGTVSITTVGGSPTAGVLGFIAFNSSYATTPRASISPLTAVAAAANIYGVPQTSGIEVFAANAPPASTALAFDYIVAAG